MCVCAVSLWLGGCREPGVGGKVPSRRVRGKKEGKSLGQQALWSRSASAKSYGVCVFRSSRFSVEMVQARQCVGAHQANTQTSFAEKGEPRGKVMVGKEQGVRGTGRVVCRGRA